jgi:hypothetical protein
MSATEFLDALYADIEEGYVEMRLKAAPSIFLHAPPDPLLVRNHLRYLERTPDWQPYFGVATRKTTANGRLENCVALPALFADCDFKQHDEPTVRGVIDALPYRPSACVATGGGLHLYWFLDEPLTDLVRARSLLDSWVRSIPVADWGVADVPRVLRLPGTLNRKYDPPRPCTIDWLEPGARY